MGTFTASRPRSLPVARIHAAAIPWRAVSSELRIEPVAAGADGSPAADDRRLPALLRVEEIDDERNRAFFSRFFDPSDDGLLLGAWREEELVGYACLYWHFSSLVPAETVLMNDLYVDEAVRGQGIGRALIEASSDVARRRGAHHLEWSTAPEQRHRSAPLRLDRRGAQRVGRVRVGAVGLQLGARADLFVELPPVDSQRGKPECGTNGMAR